ncbi:hypothetical protein [Ideonella sp.]|uniref:hypothetical protein n=1 Tax=Ideonella sp. TaxID=1929293 RepID=UPI0037BE97DB
MTLSQALGRTLRQWGRPHHVGKELDDQSAEIKAVVDPVWEGLKVWGCYFET